MQPLSARTPTPISISVGIAHMSDEASAPHPVVL